MDNLYPSSTDPLLLSSSNEESPEQIEQKNKYLQTITSTPNNNHQHIHFKIGDETDQEPLDNEMGTSLATLIANKYFKNNVFSNCDHRSHLIEGLESFLDGAVVILPGEVDSRRLISGDEFKKALRKREKEMKSVQQKASVVDRVITVPDRLTNIPSRQQLKKLSTPKIEVAALTPFAPSQNTQDRLYRKDSKFSSSPPNGHSKTTENNKQISTSPSSSSSLSSTEKKNNLFPIYCLLFRGVRNDIARRLPLYWTDIRDAANFQCLTSVVFMFFASFVPAISFGGLMGTYTDETMGTIETLFAQCICGVIWGLFSAQPLLIMSATGPVLIFEASLYNFCAALHLDFLSVRFYAGLFIFLIATCISALDGARLLVYVTRFTEDIFATLISAIFIAESLHFVWHTFKENPVEDYFFYERVHSDCNNKIKNINDIFVNTTTTLATPILLSNLNNNLNNPNISLISSIPTNITTKTFNKTLFSNNILFTSTFLPPILTNQTFENINLNNVSEQIQRITNISLLQNQNLNSTFLHLKHQSNLHYKEIECFEAEPNTALLTAILRKIIGDFGVLISITLIALMVHLFLPDPYLQRLDMPDHINFTNLEKRGHGLIIKPKISASDWYAILTAFIAALLVFILLLLCRKERGCKKGSGMHWDLVLMGICAFLCSLFGLPWMCAAAVQSLAHCSSLSVMKKTAPGARPEVDYVVGFCFALFVDCVYLNVIGGCFSDLEQRVTTIGVSLLIGLIAFGGNYLRLPLASLFGVFLYLGVMNLRGVQLIHRIVLFFIPKKYLPDTRYAQEMSIWRMHLYTWIQLICLFVVYTVKYFKKTALAFPFVLMLFIFLRQIVLPHIFTQPELKAIDGDESEDEDDYYDPTLPV
uniref:Bicarbonate transporter-like transmembrane domain-containing protein n=1 Tax=Meloidogyne floridensis TaxID=298350 RepID=A0A915NGP0_9BILA